jgi:hypothetical protein
MHSHPACNSRDDEERNERIGRLTAVIETWLIGMRRCINIPFRVSAMFSDREGTLSGTPCLAWAEGRGLTIGLCT